MKVPSLQDGQEIVNVLSTQNVISALQGQGVNSSTQNITLSLVTEDFVYDTQCAKNTYKSELANTGCVSCPSQSTAPPASSNAEACQCPSNLKRNADGSCDRVCPAGFEARTDSNGKTACAGCLLSFYKPSPVDQPCTQCPSNSFTLLPNRTSIASCLCLQGYIWNATAKLCDACPPGTSNNKDNEGICYRCSTTCPT